MSFWWPEHMLCFVRSPLLHIYVHFFALSCFLFYGKLERSWLSCARGEFISGFCDQLKEVIEYNEQPGRPLILSYLTSFSRSSNTLLSCLKHAYTRSYTRSSAVTDLSLSYWPLMPPIPEPYRDRRKQWPKAGSSSWICQRAWRLGAVSSLTDYLARQSRLAV